MPSVSAYGKVFREWESLLGAVDNNAALLPGTEDLKSRLEAALKQSKEAKLQQEDFKAKSQALTQNLLAIVDEGREAARLLRSRVKSQIGSRAELLVQFGIPPSRRRPRKAVSPVVEPPRKETPVPDKEAAVEAGKEG